MKEHANARMGRVIYMSSIGGYMAVHEGKLLAVGPKMVWQSKEELHSDAKTVGVEMSTHVINTSRLPRVT